MIFARVFRASSIPFIACAFFGPLALAQVPNQGDAPPATAAAEQDQSSFPTGASIVMPQVAKLEDDLAQLVQKRDSVPAATLPWLDLQVDSRIFARWLLAQSAAGKDQSKTQIDGFLHAESMLAVVPAIDDFASKQSAGPGSVQSIGLGRLHQLTYTLKDGADTAAFDKASAEVARDILVAITPQHQGNPLPALVPMRPDVSDATTASSSDQPTTQATEELAELARQASVSPPLRQQLIAISTLAQQAQADPTQSAQAKALTDELKTALDLSAGLQANTAVTAEERAQIESRLCDGLALFSDPRMRSAGEARLAQLDEYRHLLDRIDKMRVPPELKDSLAPGLAWAHENPDNGDKVLSAIEKFVELNNHQEARPEQPEEFASLRPIDPLRRAYEAVVKQFEKARADFLADAAGLGQPPPTAAPNSATDSATPPVAGPDVLRDRADAMGRLADLLDVLVAMPQSLQTLDAFKSYPYGGVARHVNVLLSTISVPIRSPQRDEASKQLFDLNRLATVAKALSTTQATDTMPPAIAQTYAGGSIPAAEKKWKTVVTNLAASFATNQPMDPQALDLLEALKDLFDALQPAADMESALTKSQALAKWADWTITPDQIHALLAPYQLAMAQAFAGFISDNPDALGAFSKLRPHYQPLMAFLSQTASYAPACDALPDGTLAMLSRLSTPYQKAPFWQQRSASFIAQLGTSGGADPALAQIAATMISDRLGH